ncbi:MAG: choice-of-anchor D domain-containing protein, partial [Sphingobacteriales bacterium]
MQLTTLRCLLFAKKQIIQSFIICGLICAQLFAVNAQAQHGLQFDGTDDRVTLPLAFNGSYTKEARIKPTAATLATPSPNIFSGTTTALFILGSKLTAGHAGPSNYVDVQDATDLVDGTWYHVAVTYDAGTGTMSLYKDGVLLQSKPGVSSFTETSQDLSYFFGNQFGGEMDEVRFWSTVRTQTELAANKDCELSGDEPFLVAYYNFNQGVADGNNTGLTTLMDTQDKCATALNGTLQNFALNGSTSNWIATPALAASCGSFANVNLIGNSVCIANGDVTPSTDDHTKFANQLVAPVTRTFSIQNTGGATLNISSVTISGANASDFFVTAAPPSSIAANASATFTISFN